MVISGILYKYLRMASIKLNNLSKAKTKSTSGPSYTYIDLYLDLQYDKIPNVINANQNKSVDNDRDLRIAPDEYAIKNSLINLFNTHPGQRILLPEYGCNLNRYVFQPCTTITANTLGVEIEQTIIRWEPRVELTKINVLADPANNQFIVEINVVVPSLNFKGVNLAGVVTNEGFREANTSEYI